MQFSVKGNKNYCATIVQIENKIDLEGCDNICGTIIFGNHVIISKDTEVGTIGVFFPIECSIKEIFLKANNLYRDKELNVDKEKSGFFELNGRVRCMKLRGFKSEGFWIPLNGLSFFNLTTFNLTNDFLVGTEFDHIDDIMICEKYIVKSKNQSNQNLSKKDKKNKKIKRFSKLIEEQFRFHVDTAMLAKNIHRIPPNSLISITEKLHGTSFIVSNILCNKKLSWKDRIAKKLGVNVIDKEYDNIYSSRKVVKNKYICDNPSGFYSEDIWKTVNEELQPYMQKGMTIYGECVGFLKDGKYIQKPFDYGCESGKHDNYIYRITSTNSDGVVFEWSMLQVQLWCKQNGLKAVPLHYYGEAKHCFKDPTLYAYLCDENIGEWQHEFLNKLQEIYLEKNCTICKNKVPAEGIVLRIESLDIEPFKLKSFAFRQHETKMLDTGEEDIEEQTEENIE
jgi:hypothetical protein